MRRAPMSLPLALYAVLAPALAQDWQAKSDIPYHVYGHAAALLDGRVHLLGGCHTSNWQFLSARHSAYDAARDRWETRAELPMPSGWAMPAVLNGKIYLFGGSYYKPGQGITSSEGAFVYDPRTDRWRAIRSLPEPRMNGFATTVGDHIYISLGYNRQGPGKKQVIEQYRSTYRYHPATDTYTRVADAPETGCYIASGAHKGKIYAVSGSYDEFGFHGEYAWADGALSYDPAADRWMQIKAPRVKKRVFFLTQSSASAIVDGKLWVVGGMGENRTRTEVTEYFDIEKGVFVRGPDIPYGRCCGGGGIADGLLVISGGFVGTDDTGKPALPTWTLKVAEPRR
jgi:N-acetylneuraminic acid mutarotase